MERVTTWRSSLRARWLGWTVVFGLVLVGSPWLVVTLQLEDVGIVLMALPLIPAFLIGVWFQSEWWAWGPPVAFLTLITTVILRTLFGPQVPGQTPLGMMTPREQFLFLFTFPYMWVGGIIGLVLVSALLAVSAYAGVRWGQRREAAFRDAARSDEGSRDGRR